MDSGKPTASGVAFVVPGAPSSYHMAPRTEYMEPDSTPINATPIISGSEKKKRGRPRKYKPDENAAGRGLSQVSSSLSAPPAASRPYVESEKSVILRPVNSEKKQRSKIGAENLENWVECSTGSSFLPHVITIDTGEDICNKIMEFSLQGPRAVCVVSGTGTVSSVTIRHPNSSGGTLTYEGLFEILSFSGSYVPVEMSDSRFSRSGMMKITLSSADGRVVGGTIAGLTVAASPVKVVVASFLTSSSHEVKPKKPKMETSFTITMPNSASGSNVEKRGPNNNMQGPAQNPSHWVALQTAERSRKSAADINISLQG